jgi:PAS domain S-box-containing protein
VITSNIDFALLAFVPALFNVAIIFYILLKLPKGRTTDVFICFVFALTLWQVADGLLRITPTSDIARFWDSIFSIGWLAMAPLAFHFACRYAGLKKLYSRLAMFFIYGPFVIFEVVYVANSKHAEFIWNGNWGWLSNPGPGSVEEIQRYWMSLMIILAVIILVRHALGIRKNLARKTQAWLIALGILLPALQGIVTQVVMPLALNAPEIPVTSTFMSLFSIGTIIALSRYKSLNVSESIQSDTLLESLNKLVMVVSPEGRLMYSNPYAGIVLGLKQGDQEILPFEVVFPSQEEYQQYITQVFERVVNGFHSNNYQTQFRTGEGEPVDVLITTRQVVNNKVMQGVLLVATDITENVRMEKALEIERTKKEKEITDAVLVAQEKERKNIGGELHDNVNQILASSLLYLNMVKRESAEAHPYINESEMLIRSAIQEIRKLSHALIAPSLRESELTEALDKIIDTAGKTGILHIEKDLGTFNENLVPEKLKLNIYRIVQEQFNNIIKYAHANTIQLKLVHDGNNLILQIKDDGIGFDPEKKSDGVGLMNMKTRASLHNGHLRIVSSPGQGCELTVKFENVA